jgi:hypothetical protein
MKFAKTILATAAVLVAFSSQAAGVNLVTNGSFEYITNASKPGQNTGTWTVYRSIVGWTGAPNIEVRDKVAGIAKDGGNYVELDTNPTKYSSVTNSSMYQDILGTGYVNLSFYASARPKTIGSTNGLSVELGSFSATVLNNVGNSNSTNDWRLFTFNNIKLDADGSTRLTFKAMGKEDTYGSSLDKVVITPVPEPETYAMLLAGLGLMGTIARRRNKANKSA